MAQKILLIIDSSCAGLPLDKEKWDKAVSRCNAALKPYNFEIQYLFSMWYERSVRTMKKIIPENLQENEIFFNVRYQGEDTAVCYERNAQNEWHRNRNKNQNKILGDSTALNCILTEVKGGNSEIIAFKTQLQIANRQHCFFISTDHHSACNVGVQFTSLTATTNESSDDLFTTYMNMILKALSKHAFIKETSFTTKKNETSPLRPKTKTNGHPTPYGLQIQEPPPKESSPCHCCTIM